MNFGYTVAVYFHCFPIAVAAADTVEVVYFHGFPIVFIRFFCDFPLFSTGSMAGREKALLEIDGCDKALLGPTPYNAFWFSR